jgi:hypothetical protein
LSDGLTSDGTVCGTWSDKDYGVTALANASIAVSSQAAEKTGEAKILIDPFLPDNPSRDNGWSGYLTGKNSAQGSDR